MMPKVEMRKWMLVVLVPLFLVVIDTKKVHGFSPSRATRIIPSSSSTALFARKPFITGNWKMNPKTRTEAVDLAETIANSIKSDNTSDVGLFVPFPFIDSVKNAVGDKLMIGAEVRK